jgi:hypothetical protein
LCSLYLINIIQSHKYTANANCHWRNYTEASERMHMYIWEMAYDSSCLSVDSYIPLHPLLTCQPTKVCVASKIHHAVNITNICVNRMAGQLEGNIGKYILWYARRWTVTDQERCGGHWYIALFFSGNSNNYFAVCSLSWL